MQFNPDNKFLSFMTQVADLLLLSILWLVTSAPLVTVGAASTALYYCIIKVIREDSGSVFKSYFHAFRTNFKQSIYVSVLTVSLCVLAIMLGTDIYGAAMAGQGLRVVHIVYLVLLGLCITWLHYTVSYIARFQDNFFTVLKNSFIICLAHLPVSALLLVLFVACFGVWLLFFPASVIAILVLPGLYALLSSYLLERIYKKYIPAEDAPPSDI